jgi:translation initiation factor IF-2
MPTSQIQRPPVVAIMGHVDHGKSSLLDYIRKSNIVAGEAGGITQHISAYEVSVPDSEGIQKRITFIDTPGHAAFSHMRERGATIADIAILIVSAEEGVKAQTKEAIKTITGNKVPFIVALTKIDRPNSNVMKVKTELMEQEVFVEGMGGSIPCVAISSKSGEGIPELLETILLLAELEDFKGKPNIKAEGFIVEANMDDKRGISATMIIKDGTLKQGNFVVVDDAWTTTRIIEDFMGKTLSEVSFSTPIRLTGFSKLPNIGSLFTTCESKKEAEEQALQNARIIAENPINVRPIPENAEDICIIPIIIKSDVYGTAEAIEGEILKIEIPDVYFKIIKKGVGAISESDIQLAASDKKAIIIGFHVDMDARARDINETEKVTVETFTIIYKLTEWLHQIGLDRKPEREVDQLVAQVKILKYFSSQKNTHVAGGRVVMGTINKNNLVKIVRDGEIVGSGKILELQQGKSPTEKVEVDNEFGMQLESSVAPESGDMLEVIIKVIQ